MPDTSGALFWSGLLFLSGVVVIPAAVYLARALRRRLQQPHATGAFTIQDLRDMRARGQITTQEYEAMRAVLLQQLAASDSDASAAEADSGQREKPPASPPPG